MSDEPLGVVETRNIAFVAYALLRGVQLDTLGFDRDDDAVFRLQRVRLEEVTADFFRFGAAGVDEKRYLSNLHLLRRRPRPSHLELLLGLLGCAPLEPLEREEGA